MRVLRARLLATIILPLPFLSGCGQPEVNYKAATDGEVLPNGSLRFDLRTTNVALMKGDGTQAPAPAPNNSKGAQPSAAQQIQSSKTEDVCPPKPQQDVPPWLACLQGVSASASIAKFSKMTFVAVPHSDWLHLQTTQLSATPVDNDELLIKQVTVVYKDNTKAVR